MELYRLGIACLPSRFYRVQCSKSQTIHDETGLSAPSELLTNLTEDESRYLMAEAFTWGSHITSPIIKVFSERVHAVNWALKWLNSEDERCKLLTIKTCELGDVTVSKVSTLVDKLGVNLPYGASRHKKGSHLCLNRTPARAVCPCESLSSIRAGRDQARRVREAFETHKIERPGTHWSTELHGYYDTDEGVEEINTNDNLLYG